MELNEAERTPAGAPETRLESWKAIAAYLQRNAVTVRRWEKEEGLPVHRHTHKARASVYAYVSEIDAWRAARRVLPEVEPEVRIWKSLRTWPRGLAFVVSLGLSLTIVGGGIVPQATGAERPGQTTRHVWAGDADEVDDSGSVSVDGRYLAFTDWSTGDVAVRDLLTKTNRRLTDSGGWEQSGDYGSSAVIAPDSSLLAYTWKIRKEPGVELRVIPLTGVPRAEPRPVWKTAGNEGIWPVGWTPDGRRLLVLRLLQVQGPMQELGMLDVADAEYRALERSRRFNRPRLSPDGRWVAYGEVPDDTSQMFDVRLLSTDGTQQTIAVQNPANDIPMGWSPDGRHLFFVSSRTGTFSLWSVGITDGKPTGTAVLVRPDVGAVNHLGVTRDGTFYYSLRTARRSNIYSAELAPDGGIAGSPVLLSERLTYSARAARLSPDGRLLAYYSTRPGPEHLVIVRTLATGTEQDFRPTGRLGDIDPPAPAWFPDGRSLLFAETIVQDPGTHLVRLDVASGVRELLQKVTPAVEDFRLAPNGRALFTVEPMPVRGSQTVTRLVRYDLETRGKTDLSADKWIRKIAVSPDGGRIAFVAQDTSGTTPHPVYLGVMPTDGGPSREILRGNLDPANTLEWSADQKFLLFAKLGENANMPISLWRIPADGGQATAMGLARRRGIHGPHISPDGKHLFFTGPEAAFNEIWALENFLVAKD